MAQIALVLGDVGTNKNEVIRYLRKFVSSTVGDLEEAIARGRPVFVRPLFDRSDTRFPSQLLAFLEWLESNSIRYHAYKVLDDEEFQISSVGEYFSMNSERLRTMLVTRKASFDEQRRLARLQEEVDE